MKTKVLILHNIMSPHPCGLFEQLAQVKNLDVKVLFFSEQEDNRKWKINKNWAFKFKVLPHKSLKIRGKDLFTYFINSTIIKELKKENPDIIIAAGWDSFASQVTCFWAKRKKIPFIIWSGSTINEPSWRRTVSLPLVKLMIKSAKAYISYGTRAKEYLIKLGADKKAIFPAYNRVDNTFFSANSQLSWKEKEKIKNKLGIKTKKVILYVGQLIKRKGVNFLIDAFSKLQIKNNDVSLLIIGYGTEEQNLKQQVKNQDIKNVVFQDFVDIQNMPKYYGLADLFVLPSEEEVWGLVINEAMNAALPVITTNKVGASIDLIENGKNGFIIQPKNSQELYEKMKKIINDDQLAQKMSEKSKILVKKCSYEQNTEAFLKAIQHTKSKATK